VDILTVHQAKGLEWPVVFVPSLVQSRFPSKYAGQAQDWLIPNSAFPAEARRRYEGGETEERRLFYVALTRARDMLYLSRPRKKQNRFTASPFLLEVAGGDPDVARKLPLPDEFTPPVAASRNRPPGKSSPVPPTVPRCQQRCQRVGRSGAQSASVCTQRTPRALDS